MARSLHFGPDMESIQTIPRFLRWGPDLNNLVFGLFEEVEDAEAAARLLARQAQMEDRQEPTTRIHAKGLEREALPLFATDAVRGALLGIVIGMFGTALLAGIMMVFATTDSFSSTSMVRPQVALLVLAGGLFGALAGALSFATRSRSLLRSWDQQIEDGYSILTVSVIRSRHEDVQAILRQSGALEVGSVSRYPRRS